MMRVAAAAFCLAAALAGLARAGAASRPGTSEARKTEDDGFVVVAPGEDADAVLRNPDMGWVLYENYPLDRRPGGSSTLLALPGEDFPEADAVALMIAWSDVEREEGQYDFTHVDFAYDHWAGRGKAIQLRLSTESLLWWNGLDPPSGEGVPRYLLERLPESAKQTRTLSDIPYVVVDARHPEYRKRLGAFFAAVRGHFDEKRPVTMIDLRGFGVWGEWHSGYRYASDADRREALKTIIDQWSGAFPEHWVSLSYSYDPDGPKALYDGPYRGIDEAFTRTYERFLAYSAFDHALTKKNVCFRRDGAGGAVHSNERKLCEEAFASLAHGPFMSEFCGGYADTKAGGEKWQRWMIDDALSLHPNYVNLLGWQAGDALAFCREKPEWIAHGLRTMGYRLVPLKVRFPKSVKRGQSLTLESTWTNRGVGRALRPCELRFILFQDAGEAVTEIPAGAIPADRWIRGPDYSAENRADVPADLAPGTYHLAIAVVDLKSGRRIALSVQDASDDRSLRLGEISVR